MEAEEDFAAYVAARWDALVRSAIVLGCSLHEAHDLAQTTLVRCFTAWSKVQRADDRDAYVYRMLLNCHRDSRRRRWWGEHATEVLPDRLQRDATVDVDVTDAVHRALMDLSKGQRDVIVLRYYANLSEQQAASILGIAPGTVKSRLFRALAHLSSNSHLSDFAGGQLP